MADLFFGGGLNETDEFNTSPDQCIKGANFLIDVFRRNFRRRPNQEIKGTATNAKAIVGIMQMIDRSQVETTLVKAGEVIYSWDGTTFTAEKTDTNTSSRMRATHWSLDDILVITDLDKVEPLWKWDGTSITRLKTGLSVGSPASVAITRSGSTATATHSTHGFASDDLVIISGADQAEYNGEFQIAVTGADTYTYTVSGTPVTPATGTIVDDKGVELKAKYSIVKDNRVWLFNISTDATLLPHAILASKFEDPENLDTANRGKSQDISSAATGSAPFVLFSPDLHPINGAVLFHDELIMSTMEGRLYRLTGTDPTDYNWVEYYSGSAAVGTETMVNAGNDVYFVKLGGDIDRLSDTDRSGDVTVDDATVFLPVTKRNISDPIAVYDQTNQRVIWMDNGFVLVLDKNSILTADRSPWSVWTTLMPNQFATQAATYLKRPGSPGYTVYWGDNVGAIYDLNGEGVNGDAGSYNIGAFRKTPHLSGLQTNVDLMEGRVQYRRAGQCTLNMKFDWDEEYNSTENDLPLKGPVLGGTPKFFGGADVFFNEDDYFNEGTVTGDNVLDNQVSTQGFSAVGKAAGFFLTLTVTDTADFAIERITV